MLAQQGKRALTRHGAALLPALLSEMTNQQTRGIQLFEIFSKAKRMERRKALMEETNRGYFDDFRDFRDSKGKVFFSPDRLIPASEAKPFPPLDNTLLPNGDTTPFPPSPDQGIDASLVCVAFRAGAQEMVENWAAPFSTKFKNTDTVSLYELALVESPIMKLPPFKGMIMRSGQQNKAKYAKPATYLYRFGHTDDIRPDLYMTNRLTGYVYLVDNKGLIRWRGSGNPDEKELEQLLQYTEQLIDTKEAATTEADNQEEEEVSS